MRYQYGKQFVLGLLSLCCISTACAADNASAQTGDTTNAIAFGVQAGQIAGAAQGCGINISTFTMRVNEAINKLALNPTDSSAAVSTFQQVLQQAQIVQRNNNPRPCSQVMQDFNSLPILRPDYEQSVIAQLTPGMNNQSADTTNTPSTNNTNAQSVDSTANNSSGTTPGQSSASNNTNMGTGTTNQQQNLNNQSMPTTGNNPQNNANNANNNPAFPQQNYGPMKSFSNNYSGALKPYSMSNMQSNASAQNTNAGQQYNNPPPPSFSNPNNAPPVNSGYPNQ